MIEFFKEEQLSMAKAQRKKVLLKYLLTLGVYLIYATCMMLWYWTLPYMHPQIKVIKWILYSTSVLYMIFSYVYLSIAYGRVHRYYKLCDKVLYDRKETYVGEFLRYDESMDQKDGVDCKSLIFKEWNKYKKVYFERKVLVPYEMDFPQIEQNATIRYVVQGNVLVRYEYIDVKGEQQ